MCIRLHWDAVRKQSLRRCMGRASLCGMRQPISRTEMRRLTGEPPDGVLFLKRLGRHSSTSARHDTTSTARFCGERGQVGGGALGERDSRDQSMPKSSGSSACCAGYGRHFAVRVLRADYVNGVFEARSYFKIGGLREMDRVDVRSIDGIFCQTRRSPKNPLNSC
jgi:hypothetical protein